MVGGVHASRVVDCIGIDPATRQGVLDTSELRATEVAALGEHLALKLPSVDPQRVVGAVTDISVRLALRLHVGSDASVVDKIHRCLEDRVHQLDRRQSIDCDSQRRFHLRRDCDRLGAARINAAAGGDQLGVVIGPRGSRQREHSRALVEARLRVRIGIEEDVAVIERGDQLDMPRQQHSVAKDIARHVADPRNGEIGRLGIDAHLAEVTLDRLPRAARGDAHHLVVIASRSARGECVAEPEAILLADAVGVVRERRRALVGSDHEVRIVGVVSLDPGRRYDLFADAVVGDVEQAAQIVLVAGDTFLQVALAVGGRRRALEHETALRSDRNDDRVLDHLRLDQPQNLGPEIFRPVRPAQSAARHFSPAQVHAFEARRVHKNLEHRLRLWKTGHFGRIELE